ncbi:MAG: hypoxanthine phosphoribosyltransferase [Ruminococcaceae bacterium]|nr:hypoxanthine phosphoribosyltransferase [Oscillospiraceae bacterium]
MDHNYEKAVERILCSEEQIKKRVAEIAREIENYYGASDKKLLLLGILKGSVVFMADLMKAVRLPMEVEFMRLSSYGKSAVSSGEIVIKAGLEKKDLADYNVLIVEDILDTGNTLFWLVDYLKREHNAKDIKICTLLDKPDRREKPISVDFGCFTIPDEFVIGYGLDFNELYRDLPYVGILKREYYE